jgi:hypothetical protein
MESKAEMFVRIKAISWDSSIDGKIKLDEGSLTGSTIDLQNTLGLTKSTTTPELEGRISFPGMSKLLLSYSTSSYEGSKTLTQNISFSGKTFSVSEQVRTNLDVTTGSVFYETNLLPDIVTPGENEMGFLLGLKYYYFNAQITSSSTPKKVDKPFGAPIPLIGLRSESTIYEKTQMEISCNFMSIKTSDISLSSSDFYSELKFNFIPRLPFGFGYKISKVKMEYKNNPKSLTRFEFDGWYIIASLQL